MAKRRRVFRESCIQGPLDGTPFVLASGSAVRRRILAEAGLTFIIDPADVDEAALTAAQPDLSPRALALRLAEEKALAVSRRRPELVIGADQVMEVDGRAHGKAKDPAEAAARLRALAGETHYLRGAIAAARGGAVIWTHASSAAMTMRPLSEAFLQRYAAAAGGVLTETVGGYAYEAAGAQLFEQVEGDYFAIIGLDLLALLVFLRQQGCAPE